MKVLSLGSGFEKLDGEVTTVDIAVETDPDVVCDLNVRPFPFEDSSYDMIVMFDVIEHLDQVVETLYECYRILKPGGILHMKTPHFSSANSYTDPTHKWHLGFYSFDFFVPGHERFYYSKAKFEIHYRKLHFHHHRLLNPLLEWFGNKYTWTYEQKLAWMIPACYIDIKLKKV